MRKIVDNQFPKFAEKFKKTKIGVIGDVMLDRYILGEVKRISPEASVPVFTVEKEFFAPGGAANVAANIAALGGKVFVAGVVGKDEAGNVLIKQLKVRKIDTTGIVKIANGLTTQKTRIVTRSQQLIRIDKENNSGIAAGIEKKLTNFISKNIKNWDGLIISDYAKGVVGKKIVQSAINLAKRHKKPVIGDAKPKNARYFKNISVLAPNHKEAAEMAGTNDIKRAGRIIRKKLNCSVLITQGPQGMTIFEKDKIESFSSKAKEVFDVVGAGDTVTAVLALCLASGFDLRTAAIVANHAAGIVVGKKGTSTVSPKELVDDLKNKH